MWDTDPHVPTPFDSPPTRGGLLRAVPGQAEQPDERSLGGGGHGLLLVRECADRWGGHPIGDDLSGSGGKLLWFELETRSAACVEVAA